MLKAVARAAQRMAAMAAIHLELQHPADRYFQQCQLRLAIWQRRGRPQLLEHPGHPAVHVQGPRQPSLCCHGVALSWPLERGLQLVGLSVALMEVPPAALLRQMVGRPEAAS